MDDFVTAKLIKNEAAAEYEGVIWERWLTFRHASGRELVVFDSEVMSTDASEEDVYKIVIEPFEPHILITEAMSNSAENTWQGKVVALDWRPPTIGYLCVSETFARGQYVLVETAIGSLLIRQTYFKQPVVSGTFIEWDNSRLDLFAILDNR